jgi:small subunit ribosomal protein S1
MNSKMPGLDQTDEQAETPSTAVPQPQAETETDAEAATAAQTTPETPAVEADATAESPESEASAATVDTDAAPSESAEAVPAAEATPASEPVAPEGPRLKRGEVVEGVIAATSPTQVTVEVNGLQGVIPGHELEKMSKSMLEDLKEGAPITVFVVNPRGHDGNAVLSVNRAMEELDWRRAEEYRQSQDVLESRVAGYNKGGLIVRFGRVRGFVPQSQMSAERRRTLSGETPEDRWGKMVNEPIAVKVMEVDRARNRLILSERSASRESREKRKENLISQLTKGEVRTGRVVSLEDFGAFVDIGGAEGLVHLTELSWKHVTHPREMLQVGQEVRVEVISIDRDAKRIGLSIKSQEQDPWDMVAINYNVGQLVLGQVTKLTKFGAFARLVEVPEIEGLIHISELSEKRVTHPREVVQEGDRLTLRVVKMDIANRRLGLSLKKVNSPEYLDQDWMSPVSAPPEAEESAPVADDSAPEDTSADTEADA